MDPQRIPYTDTGRFRPCFKVVFYNSLTHTSSADTFGLVDSGADDIIIPYSIGLNIGLQVPSAAERANPRHTNGIGGRSHCVPRDAHIKFIESSTKKIYTFRSSLMWICPDEEMQKERETLTQKIAESKKLIETAEKSEGGEETISYLKREIDELSKKLKKIEDVLEVDSILGRPFFDNFEYITFFHQEKSDGTKSIFEYRINKSKVAEVQDLK